jgi:hypothetical protein
MYRSTAHGHGDHETVHAVFEVQIAQLGDRDTSEEVLWCYGRTSLGRFEFEFNMQ